MEVAPQGSERMIRIIVGKFWGSPFMELNEVPGSNSDAWYLHD